MRSWRLRLAAETGSASLEFVTVGLLLLVPLVYLVVAISSIQSAALAASGAARQAARVYVGAATPEQAAERAEHAVVVALADFGISEADATVSRTCTDEANGCLVRLSDVTFTVTVRVGLPLVPDVLSLGDVVSVPVQAQATVPVSRFWGIEP